MVTKIGLVPARWNELSGAPSSFHAGPNVLSTATTLTMTSDIDDDEYVAGLLKQDAQNAKKKYELVGLDAFNPKRCVASLPGTCYYDCLSG